MGFLKQLCEGKLPFEENQIKELACANGMKSFGSFYTVVISNTLTDLKDFDEYKKYSMELKKISRQFSQKQKGAVWTEELQCGLIIFLFSEKSDAFIKGFVQRLYVQLCEKGLSEIAFFAGEKVDCLTDIPESFDHARNLANVAEIKLAGEIYFSKDYEATFELANLQSLVEPEDFLKLFRSGDMEGLRSKAVECAEKVRSITGYKPEYPHPTSIRRLFIELTVYILHITSDLGINVEELLDGIDPYNYIMTMEGGTPAIIDWFVGFSEKMYSAISKKKDIKESQLINKILKYIDDNISDCSLSLSSVSEEMSLSESYISRTFSLRMNQGFSQYVSQCRIKLAKELLLRRELSVAQISSMTGFSSPGYFGKAFKKSCGITPNEYRKGEKQ